MPAIIIYTKIFIDKTFDGFENGMKDKLKTFAKDRDERQVFNDLQFEHQCCGVNGFQDWTEVELFRDRLTGKLKSLPFSCCKIDYMDEQSSDVKCQNHNINKLVTINQKGCANKFQVFITSRLYSAIALWVVILLLNLSGLLFFQYWKSSTESAHKKGHPKLKSEGWIYLPTCGLYESTPPGYQKVKTVKYDNEPGLKPKTDNTDTENEITGSPMEKSVKRMKKLLKTQPDDQSSNPFARIAAPPSHQPKPFPSQPPTSPRYVLSSVISSIDCPECHRKIIGDYERHVCVKSVIDNNNSTVLMAVLSDHCSDADQSSSDDEELGVYNLKNYQRYYNKDPKVGKFDSKNVERGAKDNHQMTTITDDDNVEVKRKYRERYFILKEIR